MIDRASAEISKCIMRIKRKDNKKPPEIPPKPQSGDVLRNGVAVLPMKNPAVLTASALSGNSTPLTPRKFTKKAVVKAKRVLGSSEQLWKDEDFLKPFFLQYFQGNEKLVLPLVCKKWRDLCYNTPEFWSDLIPVLRCKELRRTVRVDGGLGAGVRRRFYGALVKRGSVKSLFFFLSTNLLETFRSSHLITPNLGTPNLGFSCIVPKILRM